MQADTFSDPRRRSTRGRSRGRGRDRSRGRGRLSSRGRVPGSSVPRTAKHQQRSQQQLAELGSNAYRFRQLEAQDEDQEDEFDAGIDFGDAATGSISSGFELPKSEAEALSIRKRMMETDLSGLENALRDVPLWVRLGDIARFGLRVGHQDIGDNYLDPIVQIATAQQPTSMQTQTDEAHSEFADALASLSFDDEDDIDRNAPTQKSVLTEGYSECTVPCPTSSNQTLADDFDKWLDGA